MVGWWVVSCLVVNHLARDVSDNFMFLKDRLCIPVGDNRRFLEMNESGGIQNGCAVVYEEWQWTRIHSTPLFLMN